MKGHTTPMSTQIDRHAVVAQTTEQLVIALDGIRFSDPDAAALQPSVWVDAFRSAIVNGKSVSDEVRACIQERLDHFAAEDFVANADDRRRVLDLLSPRPGISARLLEMAECGFLERLFPELQEIHRRAAPDPFRRNAASSHAVLPVRRIELLRNPEGPARARFAGLLEELRAPELLTLALLLHDVGTRRDHGHARESLRLAQPAIDRLQLQPAAAETLRFLIRHHRQMARVAFRRDAGNPDVVARFATLVGSEELLKMLCLVTLIDIEAISPEALTPWKEDRLWRLYTDTSIRLALGAASGAGQHDAGLAVAMAGRPDDISDTELARFVTGLPRAYLSVFGLSTIYGHLRLGARDPAARDPRVARAARRRLRAHGGHARQAVPVLQHRRRVVLFRHGHPSRPDHDHAGGAGARGVRVQDAEGFLAQHRGAPRQIHRMLEAVVAGSADMADLLDEQARQLPLERSGSSGQSIHLDNAQSEEDTVLEIVADDAPGFLYRITRVIAEADCTVNLALVSTEHGKAVDVLHITRDKRRLTEAEQQSLHVALEGVICLGGA